ncbi:MAG: hypothetical protein ACYSTL_04020 [Planctomycetota bacterium]|jgi:DnaJ-class molecular chaperone
MPCFLTDDAGYRQMTEETGDPKCRKCGGHGWYVNDKNQTEICSVCDGIGRIELEGDRNE